MKTPDDEEIDTILFDVDDTLFDQRRAHRLALKEIIEDWSDLFAGVSEEVLIETFDKADEKAMLDFHEGVPLDQIRKERTEEVLREFDVDVSMAEEFNKLFYDLYPSMEVPIEGAKEVISELKEDHVLGVITNSSKQVQICKLRSIQVLDYFETLVFSEEIGCRKPHPRIFLDAVERVDRRPEDCLYVGDSYTSDVVGADRVGMHTCWFNPDGKEVPGDVEPKLEISELAELL